MKSKLFLSLSLLTASFSVQPYFPKLDVIGNGIATAKLLAVPTIAFAAPCSVATYLDKQELAKQAELVMANQEFDNKHTRLADKMNDNRSYIQVATDSLKSGWNTVSTKSSDLYNSAKTTASDMYANATYENMKKGAVNGFNSTKTFVQENPYKTAGGVAAVAALTYGAYKLYNSDMFAKSKAPVVTPAPVVVKKPTVIYTKSKRTNYLA